MNNSNNSIGNSNIKPQTFTMYPKHKNSTKRLLYFQFTFAQSTRVFWFTTIISLLVILNLSFNLFAQQQDIKLDRISLEHGLSQSTIMSITQDNEGFMWFGTIDGLNKFDGYNFTIYRNNPADTNSLADDWVTSILLDKEGTLWVGTSIGVLHKLVPSSSSSHQPGQTLSRNSNKKDLTGKFIRYSLRCESVNSPISQEALTDLPFIYSSLSYNSITTICEDNSGAIWLGTFGSGIYKFDKSSEQFTYYHIEQVNSNGLCNYIMNICFSSHTSKTLWIGTYGGGIIKFRENEDVKYYLHDFSNPTSLADNRILTIHEDIDSNGKILWVGTYKGGLEKFNTITGEFEHYKNDPFNENSLSGNIVFSILKDSDGILWLGTLNNGLNRLALSPNSTEGRADQFTHYRHCSTNPNSLTSNEVISLFEDRSGIIWVGTNLGNGLNKFDKRRKKFTHFQHNPASFNSLSENVIFAMYEDSDGILWIGTFKSGLDKFDRKRNKFTHYRNDPTNPKSLSDNGIRSIYEDKKGTLWVGTYLGGLNKFDRTNNSFKTYRHDPSDSNSVSGDYIWSIFEDRGGSLWLGTKGSGLNKFNRTTEIFTRYLHNPYDPNSISDNRVISICEKDSNSLWIATFRGGLNELDLITERFTSYQHNPSNPNSLSDNRVMSILKDPVDSNVFWLGTYGGGLDRLELNSDAAAKEADKKSYSFTHFTEQNGLANNVVYSVLSDDDGNLWLSTNKGISKFNPQTETFTNYDLSDGLQSYEFNARAYHKSSITGEMFFGGINGFNSFCPDEVRVNTIVPPIVLTSFKIFDKEISVPISQIKEIELSYKDNFFLFEFSALDYTNLKKNQFAYKLEGFNEKWIKCSGRRFASYTNIDPGEYIFRVKGSNSDGVWNEQGTSIKIKINPPYWKTWWFYFLVISITVSISVLFHKQRIRINIKRSLEMERIRTSESERVRKTIAADFHDELGQKLTKISLFSEILKRKLRNISPENIAYLNKINSAAKELSRSTRDFIWSINPAQNSLYDVAIYLKDFGDEMFDKTGINFRINGISKELENIKLSMEWRRHVTLMFKEGMNNILKHAACKNVMFRIELNLNELEITLSDDGIGYEPGKISTGNGLHNIKNRAKSIQSAVNIIPNNGKGTTIQFISEIPQTA